MPLFESALWSGNIVNFNSMTQMVLNNTERTTILPDVQKQPDKCRSVPEFVRNRK